MTRWLDFNSVKSPLRTGLSLQGSVELRESGIVVIDSKRSRIGGGVNPSLAATEASRGRLSEAVAQARYAGRRTVITLRGKPAAAVVSLQDLDILERAGAAPAVGGTTR